MKTKQVIIIRKDLKMRKGKMVSQGAHASMKAILDMMDRKWNAAGFEEKYLTIIPESVLDDWLNGLFTKITCGCDSLEELKDLYKAAVILRLPCSMITDAGLTEFDGVPTITAIAIGPAESEEIDKITSELKLL